MLNVVTFHYRVASTSILLPLSHHALAAGLGQWSAPISFPLIPVAAAPIPGTGQIVAWSAYATDRFGGGLDPITQTAVWPQSNGSAELYPVYVGHDMFCPGINTDFNGNLVVTGGDTSTKTSTFISSQQNWTSSPDMVKGRGYQSSTTLSNGYSWTIGGSWNGGFGGKDGEIYDGSQWTLQPGAKVDALLTNDPEGVYRQDNHAWLFAWKDRTVFQAGPSIAMNWYDTKGTGAVVAAGNRGTDGDAMCGPVAMYDAVAGKILAVGGSPAYEQAFATANANLITISSYGEPATVEALAPMSYKRIFATSTILPDGSVFIVGGQTWGHPFSDANTTLTPELWSPVTQQFTELAPHAIPRNYHSVSVLMEDGRVFTGGGGLCGDCGSANHFDAEVFSPPYLFQADGTTPATRPIIESVSATRISVGGRLFVFTDRAPGTVTWSLVRYGSSTHTVNTDQRRAPLTAFSFGRIHMVTLPSDAGVLLPGAWLLFAMRDGVPSVGKTIYITL